MNIQILKPQHEIIVKILSIKQIDNELLGWHSPSALEKSLVLLHDDDYIEMTPRTYWGRLVYDIAHMRSMLDIYEQTMQQADHILQCSDAKLLIFACVSYRVTQRMGSYVIDRMLTIKSIEQL